MRAYEEILSRQRAYFREGHTRPLSFRLRQLSLLQHALLACEPALLEALQADLGKAPFEGYATELGLLLEELRYAKKNLDVYKRQILYHANISKIAGGFFGKKDCERNRGGFAVRPGISAFRQMGFAAPVSYTHLDVYKRQLLACSRAPLIDAFIRAAVLPVKTAA